MLSNDKKLFGKGCLTEKAINILQSYYGMAIRQTKHTYAKKKAVGVALFHSSESVTEKNVINFVLIRKMAGVNNNLAK